MHHAAVHYRKRTCLMFAKCDLLLLAFQENMKRRTEPEFSSPQNKQKKKIEDLGLTLSSTSDDENQFSNHTTQGKVGDLECAGDVNNNQELNLHLSPS